MTEKTQDWELEYDEQDEDEMVSGWDYNQSAQELDDPNPYFEWEDD